MIINLSIVSGTYNRLSALQKMVQSVRKSVRSLTYEIILVDGGSTDGTLEWARTQTDVILIEQGELLGAIKAFNAGAYKAQGKYVALLNDDIEVEGNTLFEAYTYFEEHPGIGQIAFENKVKNKKGDPHRAPYGGFAGYLYGQCSMTPKVLGDLAGWWGDEGMRTYGGDCRLSMRLWELGYPTIKVAGCAIIDHVIEDELRKVNNEAYRGPGKGHPDTDRFLQVWKDRLPPPNKLIPYKANRILEKAANGTLRTLRFKAMMSAGDTPRTALINSFARYGPTKQYNVSLMQEQLGGSFVGTCKELLDEFQPDILLLQCQRPKHFSPQDVMRLKNNLPNMFVINWDGDTHYPLERYHFEIAAVSDLQLVVSPSLFDQYLTHDLYVGYWPIGIEQAYIEVGNSHKRTQGGFNTDINFMGALYGLGTFPEAETRRDAVIALAKDKRWKFDLYGYGWEAVGLRGQYTGEQHRKNALLYNKAKMSLSISQTKDLWGYTSDRLYNICASGCTALVQRFAGMEEHGYVDGDTCIAWDSVPEMLDKAAYYLKHEDEREKIAERGRIMTVKNHTWKHRIHGLFKMLEGI